MFIRIIPHCFLGIMYVLLSLVIGEFHPFSRVTMYNSFSNEASTFYLSDTTGKLLPVQKYFRYNTDDIGHNYWAIRESKHDDGKETQPSLYETGKAMWALIAARQLSTQMPVNVQLHRVTYHLKGDSIIQTDVILYDKASENK